MNFELKPRTEAGLRLVALAEEHAEDFATRAQQHDEENSFPKENFEAMQKSGMMAAFVPEEFGGLGVESLHDLMVALNRIGRGDGSTAIAANMHLTISWTIWRLWKAARAAHDGPRAAGLEAPLRQIGAGELLGCVLTSEPGTDLRHPMTEAKRDADGGWVVNGFKFFGTLSPVSNVFFVGVRTPNDDGSYDSGFAIIPRGTAGMEIKENWDALGMRGSGSHEVTFKDCRLPRGSITGREPWGHWTESDLEVGSAGNIGLVGVFLGIAEAAQDIVVEMVRTRRKAPSDRTLAERIPIQQSIAESEIDLAACRAILARNGIAQDEYFGEHERGETDLDDMHALVKDFQCAKWFVNRKAIDIVDRALTLSGGAGYLSKSPLSRMYRDVRAGPFMQPLSPNEAFEYIGKVALGLSPDIDV